METLIIHRENAIKAYNEATGDLKKIFGIAFGLERLNPIGYFKSYEDVCRYNGIDPVASLPFPSPTTKKQVSCNGDFKLQTIFKEFNRNDDDTYWEPDYSNKSEAKWYAWFDWSPSLGALVYTNASYAGTGTLLGTRLCTNTDAKMTYIAKTFTKEFNEFLNPKI